MNATVMSSFVKSACFCLLLALPIPSLQASSSPAATSAAVDMQTAVPAPASTSGAIAPGTLTGGTAKSQIPQSDLSEYVLGAGDEIGIHVADMEEISDKPMRIDPNGFVDLPLAGRVQASGMTIEQLKTELAGKLKKYINSPQVTINLTEDQSRPISILGAVNSPGVHQLLGPRRLIEVISLAGGLRNDAGPKVILTRQAKWGPLPLASAKTDLLSGSSTATLSLDSLMDAKNPADDILVQPNDVISIPKADVVYVVGNVKKAGGFQLSSHETISLLQALALAEGTDSDAAQSRARILRPSGGDAANPKEIPVDISKIFQGKSPDVKLYANDILFVPSSATKSGIKRTSEAILQVVTGIVIYRH